MLSVIIPAYNEEPAVERAHREISGVLKAAKIDNEIISLMTGQRIRPTRKLRVWQRPLIT